MKTVNNISSYFLEGIKAFYSNKKNPYDLGTFQSNEWWHGYHYEVSLWRKE